MKTLVKHWILFSSQGEPYRVLFPLGAAIGLYGTLLWPAFAVGWLPFYPGIPHARIMVQGFVFSFMAGFLGSALPHMLEVKGMNLKGTASVALLLILVTALHALQLASWGDGIFIVTIITVVVLTTRRWPERKDIPPPGIALAALGMMCGIIGTLLMPISLAGYLPATAYTFGKILLYQGLILLPVLGLGAYLLPRMAGLPNRHMIASGRHPSPAWIARALFMLACGGAILFSFVLEATGHLRIAYATRLAATTFCLLHEVPLHRAKHLRGSIPKGLMVSVISIITGFLAMTIWPAWQMSLLHIVFISGIGLLILNIAARVILGHSGNADEIYARHRAMNWIIGLAILAMVTRVSADLIPRMQLSHYAYASLTWAVITLVWLAKCGPLLMEKGGES